MKRVCVFVMVIITLPASICPGEFQINTKHTYSQMYPEVAADIKGCFLVVWRSYRQDGDSGGIYAQWIDKTKQPIGDEFQVNLETAGNQTEPAVAIDGNGRFAVAWQRPGPNETDIYARLYDANSEPLSEEFIVNGTTIGTQRFPNIDMNSDGTFVVVWQDESPGINEYDRAGAFQRFDMSGNRIGEEVHFSDVMDCRYPDVAMDGDGCFVVVWMQDRPGNSIQMRQYDMLGTALTDPCQVNSVKFSSVTKPRVAMRPTGGYVVTWDGHEQYASMDDIYARIFDSNGDPINDQFLVNTIQEGKQEQPAVAIGIDGSFAVIWHGDTELSAQKKDVCGQLFDCNGVAIGKEFCPHTEVMEDQKYPVVAMGEEGTFLAVWQSYRQDGSDYGIFGMLGPSTCPADFTGDCFVNFRDFASLTQCIKNQNDLDFSKFKEDWNLDIYDIVDFCGYWLKSSPQGININMNND